MADTTTALGDTQEAIYAILAADTQLMSVISGVFDYVPDGQAFPYVVVGEGTANDWDTFDVGGDDLTVDLHVWSRSYGFSEANAISGHLHRLLHRKPLALTQHTFISCVWDTTINTRDPDGMTRHALCRFRILTQKALS